MLHIPHPLDEFPVHQTNKSMHETASSDRNFYDRYYFNAHDRTGDVFLIHGHGVYPNVGVVDGFVTVGRGDDIMTVRFSDSIEGFDRMNPHVGPYRIEVIEPLERIRITMDGDRSEIGFDLTWTNLGNAVMEQPHQVRQQSRTVLHSARFAQLGAWEGEITVEGTTYAVDPDVWMGSRDRSWGIRPVGPLRSEPPASWDEDHEFGMFWLYVPMRFPDHTLLVLAQEGPDGYRTFNDASRIFDDGRVEQLGWPRVEITYESGTRRPVSAVLHCTRPDGTPHVVEVETLGYIPLQLSSGYGDFTWGHGEWKGRDFIETVRIDRSEIDWVTQALGVNDHVARAVCDGVEGWGMFEHASIGRHDLSGFTGFDSVAP